MSDKTDTSGTVSGHVREMSATDRLRALLTERGVEWRRTPHYSSESIDNETVFRGEGIEWYANDHLNGRLGLRALRYDVTPEQAVAATLGVTDATGGRQDGAGTCHSTTPDDAWCFACSECGKSFPRHELHLAHNHGEINYCPNCGRKVEP